MLLPDLFPELPEPHTFADLVWAFDPGDRFTGWAAFVRTDSPVGLLCVAHGTVERDEIEEILVSWVESPPPWSEYVVEDYRLYPDKSSAQGYSDFPTSRLIGWFELVAAVRGVELVKQGASVKRSAYGLLNQLGLGPGHQGSDEAGRPYIHGRDARAHGAYYLRKQQAL